MSINSILKKEGIVVIKELNDFQINTILKSICSKLCLVFPEHGFNKNTLLSRFNNLNMYISKMPEDSSGAKYLYKNNSIYFNVNLTVDEMANIAVHECIHFLQREASKNRMGLYNFSSGLAINEAAVQLMASEANFNLGSSEKYYNIYLFHSISPNYYPLECTIVNEMAYFTGTFPLYESTLNSNDVFSNTFIEKSNKQVYFTIVKNLDNLLNLENELNYFVSELQIVKKVKSIRLLNKLIDIRKQEITLLFFKTQNLIIKTCFYKEFNSVRNISDLKIFKKRLYDFKNIIGTSDNYSFYNDFYCDMMNAIEKKEAVFEKYTEINLFKELSKSLALVDTTKASFDFVKILSSKFKKVFDFYKSKGNINEC